MWLVGVFLAGIVFIVRPLPGILNGMRTGVLIGKGYAKPRISREAEPERFNALMRQRLAEITPGVLLVLGALGWAALNILAAGAQASAQG